MKIKKPSLKGMKNTGYLGHFAQDEYIQQGHNFSGQVPLFREPSQLEMAGPANPFDATNELSRRQAQVDAEATALRQTVADNTGEVRDLRTQKQMLDDYQGRTDGYSLDVFLGKLPKPRVANPYIGGTDLGWARRRTNEALASAEARSKEGREKSYRASRKKFTTEI